MSSCCANASGRAAGCGEGLRWADEEEVAIQGKPDEQPHRNYVHGIPAPTVEGDRDGGDTGDIGLRFADRL